MRCSALSVLKPGAYRNDPAVVEPVELRHSDPHGNAKGQVKSFREWKPG